MKIVVTGREGRLYETVARALSARSGYQVVAVPVGSKLLEMARSRSVKALVFVLHTGEELEPLRWILEQNRFLPVLTVLSRQDANLQKLLREEGVSPGITAQGLTAAQLHRKLVDTLDALRSEQVKAPRSGRQCAADLHAIRSTLTAILGNAELAMKYAASAGQRHQLQEITRGVAEIERILRRLERGLRSSQVRAD